MPEDFNTDYLITSDLHLVDTPSEEYRWKIFDVLADIGTQNDVSDIFVLGDVWDRKDRHSASLVQRSIFAFLQLQEVTNAQIWILSGNHDQPITGPYFWNILNYIPTEDYLKRNLRYLTKRDLYHKIYLLPFSSNPAKEWEQITDYSWARAVLMHQTGQGVVENGRELTSNNLPQHLTGVPIFSGDVHRPQTTRGITYVGAPYPIKYNESWDNRVILIEKGDFKNFKSIPVQIMQKAIVDISNSADLEKLKLNRDAQIKVRYKLTGGQLTNWPIEEEKIRKWCESKGIKLMSLEASVEGDGVKAESSQVELMKPEELIRQFCKDEKLNDKILEVGLSLVKGE